MYLQLRTPAAIASLQYPGNALKVPGYFALLMLILTATAVAQSQEPPVARQVDTVDHVFGLTMPDPYRWMEGENNAEFSAWLTAQGAASRRKLDSLPTLASWRERLTGAAGATTRHSSHRQVGGRLFFLRAPAGKEAMLMVREPDGREHVIVDPAKDPGSSLTKLQRVAGRRQGRRCAIGHGGNEIGELAVFDIVTGTRLPDTLKPVWSEFDANWLPDSSGFFYTRMRDIQPGDADPLQGTAAYLHGLSRTQANDRLIARAGADDALKIPAHDFPIMWLQPNSDWIGLVIGGARASQGTCWRHARKSRPADRSGAA